jgi:hypothetical protein
MMPVFAVAAAIAIVGVLAPAADAVPLVVTNGSALIRADTNNLPAPSAPAPVTGMQLGETLVAIDQRPATGQLYGIGSQGRVYVLDPISGAATQLGTTSAFTPDGTAFGGDINPVPDRIRLVSNTEQNLRLNPNDGSLTQVDTPLNPAANVVAAAYTSNVSGATSTTLYDIDSVAGTLLVQGSPGGTPASPNGGTLTTVGSLMLGTNLNPAIGFDIGADTASFATITVGGMSRLYGIDLGSGLATNLGQIGDGTTSYLGLAVMPARVRLTSATVAASEGGTAIFEVTRNAPAAGAVSVDYSTAAGTASGGDDFTPASGTLAWGAGESGAKTVAVPIPADSGAEGDETFSISLSNITGADAVLGAPVTATATIAANEAGPALQFSAPSASVSEGGNATLDVTRVGSATQPVSVDYTSASGTATGDDYTPATGTLSWAAGDSAAKTISIPIADDQANEPEESFGVSLQGPTGGATLGNPASATVTIAASDSPVPPPKPTLKLGGARTQKLRTVRRRGVEIVATVDGTCRLSASVRRGNRRIGRATRSLARGRHRLRIKIAKRQRGRLRARQRLTVSATCSSAAGKSKTARRTIRLKRG